MNTIPKGIDEFQYLLNEINTLKIRISALENNFNLLNSYNALGTYTLNNIIIGKPLIFGIKSDATNNSFLLLYKITSGSLMGKSNYVENNNGAYGLGRNSAYISSCSDIIIPNDNTISFAITYITGTGTTLYVYQ